METLRFTQHGQWTLEKTSRNGLPANEDFLSYRSLDNQGTLPEDHGQKGMLHANPPSRSPKHNSKKKMQGKVPTPVSSQYADNHPGQVATD